MADKEKFLLKLDSLKKIDLFCDFSQESLEVLAKGLHSFSLKKGEVLFEEGDEEKSIFVILSGELEVLKAKKPLAVKGPGEYIGEMSLIEHKPRSASAVALSDLSLMEIQDDFFKKYLLTEPEAVLSMLRTLSCNLRKSLEERTDEMRRMSIFAHDMRNCLIPLNLSSFLLEEAVGKIRDGDGLEKKEIEENLLECKVWFQNVYNNLNTMVDQSMICGKGVKAAYERKEGDLTKVIQETIKEVSYHKLLGDKTIIFHEEGKIPVFSFNALDIKRVIQNLLLNAGYVTKEGDVIELTVRDEGDHVHVEVKDEGMGIPEVIQPYLLKEVYTSKPEGNGFGLLSCREVIQRFHNGKIWFVSKEGEGTVFHFTLSYDKKGG